MTKLDVDGVEIYYEEHGRGEPLLLIHGAAASGRWFRELVPLLAADHRVIVPDLRGLGRSQRISVLERPQVWVEDMWRVLDAVDVDVATIVGVSLGSRIAGRMALEQPDRVRSLIVDAPIIGLSSHGNASLNNTFSAVDEHSEQAREWRMLHGDDWRTAVEFYAHTRGAPGFQEYYTLRPHLPELNVPTLVCRGDLDDAVHPVDDVFVWHKQAPNTQLWIVPGLSQSSAIQERCPQFVEAVNTFLAQPTPSTLK